MIDEAQKRRNDALRIARELLELTRSINRLEQESNSIYSMLTKLGNGVRIEKGELKALGITETSPMVLRIRLQGLLSQKNDSLEDLRARHRDMSGMLRELEICPSCQGQGVIARRQYIRSEGTISPQIKMENCTLCSGTGKLNLGEDVMRIVKSLNQRSKLDDYLY